MQKKLATILVTGLCMISIIGMAQTAPVQWSSVEGGNNHWYDIVNFERSWDQANTNAQTQRYGGMQGHLATLTSAEENVFVWSSCQANRYWLGGYQTDKVDEPGQLGMGYRRKTGMI